MTQLRAVALVVGTGLLAALACAAFPTVRSLDAGDRALEGAIVLAVILALGAVSAFAIRRLGDRDRPLPLPRHHGWIAAALVAAMLVLPVAVAAGERGPHAGNETPRAGAGRLASADSPRYEYWRVALRSFADHPVEGVGAGGFAVEWLRERSEARTARDAHSLPIETLAELGLVGGAALALLAGGVAVAARRVHRFDPVLAAGPAAALTAYAFHASIDWDWEMPALTLVGVALAGLLLASSDEIAASTATAPSTTSAGSAANRNRVEP
jgi:O-antigen ligase